MSLDPSIAARLKRNEAGLFTAVVQQHGTGDVLMVAWMDDDALARTLQTREATYFSRSRGEQWIKGATSGHTQYVRSVRGELPSSAYQSIRQNVVLTEASPTIGPVGDPERSS